MDCLHKQLELKVWNPSNEVVNRKEKYPNPRMESGF